jgi:hypothetical protein
MSSIGASASASAIVRRTATCRSRTGGSDTTKRPWRAGSTTAASADAADPESVADLGEWYLECPSAHRDPRVVRAYRQLQEQTDILFAITTRGMGLQSVRIVFTRCRRPYESDEELLAAVALSGTLEITSAATAKQRLHPLLDCDFGGGFDRFRAVHDLIGHFWCGYGFQITDELAAWHVQDHMHHGLARLALANELCGVNAARCVVGEAPDLKALLLVPLRGSLEQEIA